MFAVLLSGGTGDAAAASVTGADVSVSVAPDSVFVGERFRYSITVRHDAGRLIAIDGLDRQSVQPFELVGKRTYSVRRPDGREEFHAEAELAAFGSGKQRIPSFTVRAGVPGGAGAEQLEVKPGAGIVIRSVTDAAMKELRPVTPLINPSIPPLLVFSVVAGVLLLVVLARVLLGLRGASGRNGRHPDPAPAAQHKLKVLGKQLARGLPPAEGYEALSNIMREFLQNRYRFRAMELVTQEIAAELQARGINVRDTVLQLLVQADLIKFADSRPDIEDCRHSIQIAETLIRGAGDAEHEVNQTE